MSPEGEVCSLVAEGSVSDHREAQAVGQDIYLSPPTATYSTGRMHKDRDNNGCWDEKNTSGDLLVGVTREGSSFADQALPLELLASIEPDVADNGETPTETAPVEQPPLAQVAEPIPVEPGLSFAGARALSPGAVVAEIVPGEAHFFKVPADYGQTLRVNATVATDSPLTAPEGNNDYMPKLSLRMSNPNREPIRVNSNSYAATAAEPNATLNIATPGPIVYSNRMGANLDTRSNYLGSDQYVIVSLAPVLGQLDDRATPVRYVLTTEVAGDKIAGPTYASAPRATTASALPTTSAENTTALPEEDSGNGNKAALASSPQ